MIHTITECVPYKRPGQSRITTPRKETDTCEIYSGVAEGMTTGSPIMVKVPNTDQRGHDYSEMSISYRPSHADAAYDFKYGVRSVQGGGRSSARETIGRVAAGAVAKKILKLFSGTEILAYVSQVHKVILPEDLVDHESLSLDEAWLLQYQIRVSKLPRISWHPSSRYAHLSPSFDFYMMNASNTILAIVITKFSDDIRGKTIESNIVRCPNPEYAEKMIAAIDAVRVRGDSVGGVVTCIARNVPRGLGSPVFDKLEAELAKAAMSLPATKGFEFGSGFAGTFMTGSEHNDEFFVDENGRIRTRTNRSGGIQKKQHTVTRDKHATELIARGRHDPCVVPRAVPMVEAMVALVLVDQLMAQYAQCNMFPINPALQEPLELPRLEPAGSPL
ncbi:hypothetical protein TEA_001219 [Camellia sinensis var. sinensis]|uniref:chorismate synthase n=1 Tax=Camellia sinensis var. sinensis TaxID=542762 RepID=A0A4S4EW76_CAMSN|nr:hypothetical protein TEA_001219 [Camellia sinensis var. sinensis]